MKEKIFIINDCSYCYYDEDDGYNEARERISDKYNYIFWEISNTIDIVRPEELFSLIFIEDLGVWKAEIWNSETLDTRYIDIDQEIFKDI